MGKFYTITQLVQADFNFFAEFHDRENGWYIYEHVMYLALVPDEKYGGTLIEPVVMGDAGLELACEAVNYVRMVHWRQSEPPQNGPHPVDSQARHEQERVAS